MEDAVAYLQDHSYAPEQVVGFWVPKLQATATNPAPTAFSVSEGTLPTFGIAAKLRSV
jgi:hypothetical protein